MFEFTPLVTLKTLPFTATRVAQHIIMLNNDIILMILGLAHHSDLPVLCRVNSFFHSYVVDTLYSDITYPADIAKLCRTVNASPHLAIKIKNLAIIDKSQWVEGKEFLESLAEALGHMSNLRTLQLLLQLGPLSWILEHTTFRLQSFHCSFECEPLLLRFLETQSELEELVLSQPLRQGAVLDPTSLPKLSIIRTPVSWTSLLIPSRPIYDVTMLPFTREPEPGGSIDALCLSTRPIKSLHIDFQSFGALVVQIPFILSTVERLSLVLGGPHVDGPLALSDVGPIMVDAIPCSPKLRFLSIVLVPPCSAAHDKDYEAFLNVISGCKSQLEIIMFRGTPLETSTTEIWVHVSGKLFRNKWIRVSESMGLTRSVFSALNFDRGGRHALT